MTKPKFKICERVRIFTKRRIYKIKYVFQDYEGDWAYTLFIRKKGGDQIAYSFSERMLTNDQ